MYVKWKLDSIRLVIVSVSTQDRCTFSMNVLLLWTHPIVLLGDVGQVEASFNPFGDSVNLGAR
jgi:hypothetical protein